MNDFFCIEEARERGAAPFPCTPIPEPRLRSARFQLTIPNTYSTITVPASLRSDGCSPSLRNAVRLHRNTHTNTTAGPKELFTLQLKDYDREQRRIHVGRKEAKNAYRIRVIPLNEVAYAAMERVLELAKKRGSRLPEHYLFPYRISGNAYGGFFDPRRYQTTCRTAWKKLTIAANLPGLRPYDCRHCAITNLLQNPDVSEETVKAIAGHVSPEILKTYSHIRLEVKQAALDALVKKSFKGTHDDSRRLP